MDNFGICIFGRFLFQLPVTKQLRQDTVLFTFIHFCCFLYTCKLVNSSAKFITDDVQRLLKIKKIKTALRLAFISKIFTTIDSATIHSQ